MLYYFPNRPFLLPPDDPKIIEYSNDSNYHGEIKKNGNRLVLQKAQSKHLKFEGFTFFNRQKEVMKYQPCPELLDELQSLKIPSESQLDGELMHFKTKDVKHTIFFYDVYVLDGQKIRVSLEERRQILYNLFGKREFKHIIISEIYPDNFLDVFNNVIGERENEGLVIKDKRGKLVFNPIKSVDVSWQTKIRRPEKNYRY